MSIDQFRRIDDATKRVVSIIVSRPSDESPDLSWLEQTDAEMGEGFAAQAQERLASYGETWEMVGVVATAQIVLCGVMQTIRSGGIYGVESDSDDAYFAELAADEVAELTAQLTELGFTVEDIAQATTESEATS